ncbi:MAG: hypothetical protein WBE74_01025 [Terracidiphilus sp.]
MQKLSGLTLAFILALSTAQAFALEHDQATYAIGTVQAVKMGTVGTVDLTSASELVFHSTEGQFAIPYAQVVSYSWREQLKKPLGVLPTIALALVIWPPKTYYVTVTWRGDHEAAELATFEVSKLESQGLAALFQARAPGACKPRSGEVCGRQW